MSCRSFRAFLAVAVVALASACTTSHPPPSALNQPAPESGSGLSRIHRDGKVRVCSTGDYRPFTYRDAQGQWSGLDIEMAHDLAGRLGVTPEIVGTTWGTFMTDLGAKCDLAMGGISVTLERAQKALYSAPYLRDGKAAIARCADASKYQTFEDIDQPRVRIVVNPNGTNADFDNTHIRHATILTYPDNNTIFEQLTSGAADVMITDTSEIRWQTNQNPQLCGVGMDQPFSFQQKAYVLPLGDTVMQQWVDQWLNIVRNDGTFAAISQKYFGKVMGP
jgi:cyclohexadienyl dehydratase